MRALVPAILFTAGMAHAGRAPVLKLAGSTASPEQQRSFKRVLGGEAKLLSRGGLVSPKKVAVTLVPTIALAGTNPAFAGEAPGAHYDSQGHYRIDVGATLGTATVTTGSAPALAIAEHELGHTFFQASLLAWAPRYRAKLAQVERTEAKISASNAEIVTKGAELGRRLAAAPDAAGKAAVTSELQAWSTHYAAQQGALTKALGKDNALLSGVQAYHELFADSATVLYEKDPDAMSRALDSTQPQRARADALRGFAKHASVATTKSTMDDPTHELSAPIRSYIWKTYEARAGERLDPRPAMLTALAKASAALYESRLQHGHANFYKMSIRGFSAALEQKLAADPSFTGN